MQLQSSLSSLLLFLLFTVLAIAAPAPDFDDDILEKRALTQFATKALAEHNKYRAKHGAKALVWDNNLAQTARAYALKCKWGHSGAKGMGENLAYRAPVTGNMNAGQYDPTSSIKSWYDEWPKYNGAFSMEAGHFSQLVWKSTTKVGCSMPVCSTLYDLNGKKITEKAGYLVCNYQAPGNVAGQFAQNVQARPS